MIATVITSLGIGYTLLKGTMATDTLSDVPANPAFDDMNFYKCVVDAYNRVSNSDVGYDVSLSDEQLGTILSLSCGSKNIISVSGIEKMTSLTKLYLDYNELTELDVSKNTALTELSIDSNKLTSLDVSKNTALL